MGSVAEPGQLWEALNTLLLLTLSSHHPHPHPTSREEAVSELHGSPLFLPYFNEYDVKHKLLRERMYCTLFYFFGLEESATYKKLLVIFEVHYKCLAEVGEALAVVG